MADTVEPRLARGLRDLLPQDMLARQWMIDTIREVYERYGFVPLGTPAIEYLDVLSGAAGEEAQLSIYRVHGREIEKLGLRFDLTVPLARVCAQYPDLPRPFRRYQVAPVWRTDKPGAGRYREFTQFDIDSVGVDTEVADVEIITAMCDALSALNVESYRVRFSSRRILNLLNEYAGIPAGLSTDVFRVLDKLDKIGPEKLRLELTAGYQDESGDTISGLGLAADQVAKIERFLTIQSADRESVLDQLRDVFRVLPRATAEIDTLARMSGHLDALGYGSDRVVIDLSVARGLAYYTGPVFEAVLPDAPQFGSVFGGGRFDELVLRFLGERVPATGASIGIDRLLDALQFLKKVPSRRSTAQVLVTVIDPGAMGAYLALAYELRRAGIRAEVYLGSERSIGKQLKYADQCDIPVVAFYGPDEVDRGVVTLKDMEVGRRKSEHVAGREEWIKERPGQVEVKRSEIVPAVSEMVGLPEGKA